MHSGGRWYTPSKILSLDAALASIRREARIAICREDLPANPRWIEEKYPEPRCWDPEELVIEAVKSGPDSMLWGAARRLWWEFYHRYHGTYRRGRPLPALYVCYRECTRIDSYLDGSRIVRLLYHLFLLAGEVYGLVPRTYA